MDRVSGRTRYATCAGMDVAFQEIGEGAHALVVFPPALIPIDSVAFEPSMNRFHQRLASFCKVIRFDHRGFGLSSRVPSADVISAEFWAQDALAVMDAVGCSKAMVFVSGFTSFVGLTLAAEYPERVSGLIIVNGAARFLRADDYPFGVSADRAASLLDSAYELDAVDQGVDILDWVAPSAANDEAFRTWWDTAGNRAASPGMAKALGAVAVRADVRALLAKITAPTLILHRRECAYLPPEHGRYLAERIPHCTYIEVPGADTLYWVGETTAILGEIEEFVTGVRGGSASDRALATVLFTDIVGSTEHAATLGDDRWHELLDKHDFVIRTQLQRFGGREVNTIGDGFLAVFGTPSAAIDCADALVAAVRPLGIQIRAGIHVGEVEVRGGDVAGMAVHIGARIASLAAPSEVLMSSTVREAVTGSGRAFLARGEHQLKGVPGRWQLFSAQRRDEADEN